MAREEALLEMAKGIGNIAADVSIATGDPFGPGDCDVGHVAKAFKQKVYENQLMSYIHFHNWHARNWEPDCEDCASPSEYLGHIFWVGFYGEERENGVVGP